MTYYDSKSSCDISNIIVCLFSYLASAIMRLSGFIGVATTKKPGLHIHVLTKNNT